MTNEVRIKLEPMSPVGNPHLDDDDSRLTVVLYHKENEEECEDIKPHISTEDVCIVVSSDDENPVTARDRNTSTRPSNTKLDFTSKTPDRRPSRQSNTTGTDSRRPSRETRNESSWTRDWMRDSHTRPVLILKEVETQTDPVVIATNDATTSVDGVLGDNIDAAVNTDVVRTVEVGINVDIEDLLLSDVDFEEPEDSVVETTDREARITDKVYYACKICSCYYLSFKLLFKHSTSQHNKTIAADVEKVPYDKKCKYCSSVYVFATYNKHIKNKHPDKFNKKIGTRRNDLSGPYECVICNTKFLTYNEGKRHRKVHGNTEQKFILRKIRNTSDTPTTSNAVKVESAQRNPMYKKPIPKSVLFQCQICELNFFNYRNGLRHRIMCGRGDKSRGVVVNCSQCDRKFLSGLIKGHYQQHFMTNQFKIEPILDGIEHKILYRCMKCKVCMDDRGSRLHFQVGCALSVGIPCTICILMIDKEFMSQHMEAHSRMGLTKDDIILVDVCDL